MIPALLQKALEFRKQRIIEGHSPDERHVMGISADEVLLYHAPLGGPYMTFDNPFGRPELFGVEFKTS